MEKKDFMCPCSRYRGNANPQNLAFDANLQEFSHRVNFIVGLQTGGKLSPEESYIQIESLWQDLQHTRKQLGIGRRP